MNLLNANLLVAAAQSPEPDVWLVVVMGLVTVFVMLVLLIGIIKLMGAIMQAVTGKKKAAQTAVPAPAAVPAGTPARQAAPAGDPQEKGRLVAAIATAIAEEMGETVEHIRIHSIRRL